MPFLRVNVPTNRKCAYYLNHDISIYKIFMHYDLLPLDYEDEIGIGSPQIWMWVSAAVEEIIPVEAIVVFYCLRLLLPILTLRLMGQVRSALRWKKIKILSLLRHGTSELRTGQDMSEELSPLL